MKTFIGIDGGGTKTDFVLCYLDGHIHGKVVLGGCNPNEHGIDHSIQVLTQGISLLIKSNHDQPIHGLFAGVSGCLIGHYQSQIQAALLSWWPSPDQRTKITVNSDLVNALTGAVGDGDGGLIIAGTGSVGYARKDGAYLRIGGYGRWLEQPCSGYDLGRKAILAFLQEQDGMTSHTLLTELIAAKGWQRDSIIGAACAEDKSFVASFAPLVFQAAAQNDPAAQLIVDGAATSLAAIIQRMQSFQSTDAPMALTGGLLHHREQLVPAVLSKLPKRPILCFPSLPPVYGACVEAIIQSGEQMESDFEKNFTADWISMENDKMPELN